MTFSNNLLSLYKCGYSVSIVILKKINNKMFIVIPLEWNDPECEQLLFWFNVSDG